MKKTRNYVLIINNMWYETTYQVYDSAGNALESGMIQVSRFDEEAIFELIAKVIKKYQHIQVIGLCVYGVVKGDIYLTGTTAKNWKEIPLGRNIKQRFQVPVIMMNDLRAAAYGSSYLYDDKFTVHQRDKKNLIFLNLSTMGTGTGIMIGGVLHQGSSNIAGETGFMPLIDSYADDLYMNRNMSHNEFCKLTARYIATLHYIVNPEMVVIGGDYFEANMLKDVEDHLEVLSPTGIYPKLYWERDYDRIVTLGVYHYTRDKIIEEELWFQENK